MRRIGCARKRGPMIEPLTLRSANAHPERFIQVLRGLLIREPWILVAFTLIVGMTYASPHFLTIENLLSVLRQAAIVGVLACGVSWLLISGTIDLSIGSLVSLISVASVGLLQAGWGTPEVIIAGLTIGLAAGLANGICVGYLRANPVIVTLGTLSVWQGLAYLVTSGQSFVVTTGSPYLLIGDGKIGLLAVPSLILIVVATAMHLILSRTPFGQRTYAIGSDPRAADLAGLHVARNRLAMFLISGSTAAVAAFIASARAGSGDFQTGKGLEFLGIQAAVLGGVYLFGGRGNTLRAILGAVLLTLLFNAQVILGLPNSVQLIVQGAIVVGIVAAQVRSRPTGKIG